MKPMGRVSIVGAGPGDADLLTLKAAKTIAHADVLLVDDLVHTDVLAHARGDARIVYVGKRGGCASTPQAFICKLLVAEAKQGHNVVRLKGGDPAIFSRAAEEIAALQNAGIDYEIVPGITAASAASASLGLPLTDRDYGHGVVFITGHAASDDAPIQWRALLNANVTLAIYMGVSRVRDIVAALRAAGARDDLPCAVISHVAREDEQALGCALSALENTVRTHAVASPAILLIGEALKDAQARALALNQNLLRSRRQIFQFCS
jgi:uroporphyrin-III C-methyltransferase